MVAFSLIEWLILGFIVLVSFLSAGVWSFIKLRNLRWNYNYVVWETVNGADKQEPTKRGRCRLITIGDQGEEVYYLQKLKKYKIAYGKKVGKNTIYWAIGDDGLWYNTDVGNFNKNFRSLGLMPVDRDVRYASTSIRKVLDNKYNKMDKTTQTVLIITFVLLLIGIGINSVQTYLAFSKQKEISALNNDGLKMQQETAKLFDSVINKIDTIKQGGSGYTITP